MAHIFTNQPNTFPALASMTMYASNPKHALKATATIGMPPLVTYENIIGAVLDTERLWSARDEEYSIDEDADHADVRIAALITDGKPLIPAVLMAITNGDRAAVDVASRRSG